MAKTSKGDDTRKRYKLYIVLHYWGGYAEEPSVYYFKTQRPLFKFTDRQVAKACGIDFEPSNGEWLQISTVDRTPILKKETSHGKTEL